MRSQFRGRRRALRWRTAMLLNAPEPTMNPPQPVPDRPKAAATLISDEPTIELVISARAGNRLALEALLERCLPPVKRWAHGRLPAHARGALDTGDLVQEAAMHVLARLDKFEPRHVGAMQAYLRMSVVNRIRDEIRRVGRRPEAVELTTEPTSDATSPLEVAIRGEAYERYRCALVKLRPRDREMVVGRVEMQWSVDQIAQRFRMPSLDAARVAVSRALKRLTAQLSQ
jgi:RNA polymerase sigma-70 factor, ECF subfamily